MAHQRPSGVGLVCGGACRVARVRCAWSLVSTLHLTQVVGHLLLLTISATYGVLSHPWV